MTTESTPQAVGRISEQLPAIQALASLAQQHATLPEAYITLHAPMPEHGFPGKVDLQMQSAQEFEVWREALGIDPDSVALHATLSSTWLAADGHHQGVTVHISGFNIPVTRLQADEPRDTTEAVSA
ncbi:hypothetical protein [Streptomyces olivaceus]|uniref:hypothetical protein n=1 Tax=Streptomyces olivaceus TaxID=47716 RepID=UPI0037B6D1E5